MIQGTSQIAVALDFGVTSIPLGRLALRERKIYFEYSAEFLKSGLNVSPFHLPLCAGVRSFEPRLFEGLPGLFNDSLPDGWGRLLLDRSLRADGVLPEEVSPLDRLAHVGTSGMGALTYRPDRAARLKDEEVDLDRFAQGARQVLEGEAVTVLSELLAMNGSSAGARPKAVIGFDRSRGTLVHGARRLKRGHEPWLVKFANGSDGPDSGAIEYVYAEMARRAGLPISDTYLFASKRGAGYFATQRFDRRGPKRLHMHTASGLLHSDFRTPTLDYEDLLELTMSLTRDVREVEKMFRLACFNVLAHNRDDHSKNFSFLMDEEGEWKLSPPYDLTFSSGPGGEQSTTVMGEGKAPGLQELYALGERADLGQSRAAEIVERTLSALIDWPKLAKAHGVIQSNVRLIQKRLNDIF